jgi:hypothetical protein
MKKILMGMAVFFLSSAAALSQQQYGNIRGIVVDKDGLPLPGATVTLESKAFGSRHVTIPESGAFRFINITPSVYTLKCGLAGFKTYIQQNLDIRVGSNYDLCIIMEVAALEEEVTVRAESPIVDTKKTGTSTNVTQDMLQEIPSARDPWVILQQVPGIQMSMENVGGNYSGQQDSFISKGSDSEEAMWNMDGVSITDIAALGSPFYYDFDSFEEMNVVTGGQDASIQTGGVSLNFITRRGGNRFQGMARFLFSNHDLQADNRTQELIDLGYSGNRINQITDYGFQFGGPIVKDKAWFWLGYGVQDIRNIVITGYPDNTLLRNYNAKLNLSLSRNNRMELSVIIPDKTKKGRLAGPTVPPESTWNQHGLGTTYIKLEDEHDFSSNFLLSLKLAAHKAGFECSPEGGMDVQTGYDLATGMMSGSNELYFTKRPGYSINLDGNYFREKFLGGDHELKFGAEYRLEKDLEHDEYPQDVFKYYWDSAPFAAEALRLGNSETQGERLSFYLSDSYIKGRLTLNLAVRLDIEKSVVNESDIQASKIAPEIMPALTINAFDPGFTFYTVSPRFGFTFDLTGDGKTMLRGNLARYGSQLGSYVAYQVSTAQFAYAGYLWSDINGDNLVTKDELSGYPYEGLQWFSGFDPWNPTQLESPNAIDKDLKSPFTDEFLLGLEREVFTDFSLAAMFILRRNHRTYFYPLYDKATNKVFMQADYVGPYSQTITSDGRTYNVEYWTLDEYRPAGTIMTNRPDYHEDYTSLEISATKRLAKRWMMNASFTYQIQTVHYGSNGFDDPTNIKILDGARLLTWGWWGSSDWMAKMSFLYQLPWGFNVSWFANARQGYMFPEQAVVQTPERADMGLGADVYIYTARPGEKRLPVHYDLDIGLTKDFHFKEYGVLTLVVDAFNVFNFAVVQWRDYLATSPTYYQVQEILNPRVVRFGIKYRF